MLLKEVSKTDKKLTVQNISTELLLKCLNYPFKSAVTYFILILILFP